MTYTKEIFIEKAISKHGQKYKYDNVNFDQPITIVCCEHGVFEVIPKVHIRNTTGGCSGCLFASGRETYTKERFVMEATKTHNGKYRYKNFINTSTPIEIVCMEHGPFTQSPEHHLNGARCHKCVLINRGCKVYDSSSFKLEIIRKYGEIFTFDNSIYVSMKTEIEISCILHGPFKTTPKQLLLKNRCPKCKIPKKAIVKLPKKILPNRFEEFKKKFTKKFGNRYTFERRQSFRWMRLSRTLQVKGRSDGSKNP